MFFFIATSVTLLALAFTSFYFYFTRRFGSFRTHGIAEVPAIFPWGSEQHKKMLAGKVAFQMSSYDLYYDYPSEKMVGHFGFNQPFILLRDIELIKNILIKDFDYFTDRRNLELSPENRSNRIVMNMPTALKGETWKVMRNIMSPVFTTGKMKSMIPLLNKATDELSNQLDLLADKNEMFEAKDLYTDWTLDVIASCGFGVEANAFKHENNIFRDMVRMFAGQGRRSFKGTLRLLFILSFPKVAKLFKLSLMNEEAIYFLEDVVKRRIEARKTEKVARRGDLIDLALEAIRDSESSSSKEVEDDQFERDAVVKPTSTVKLSKEQMEELVVANVIQLFHAGYETTSTIMGVITYFLAKNPDVQEKIFDEIQSVIGDQDPDKYLDYDMMKKLHFLEMVIFESTRHYPLTVVERLCVKDYKVPGMNYVIPAGMVVQIPTLAIMMDEQHYTNPKEFNPENFSAENKAKRSPYSFLSFGQGPRNCIGMRFAILQMKLAFVRILSKFKFIPCEKTVDKLEPDPISRSSQPIGGIWVKIEKRL